MKQEDIFNSVEKDQSSLTQETVWPHLNKEDWQEIWSPWQNKLTFFNYYTHKITFMCTKQAV